MITHIIDDGGNYRQETDPAKVAQLLRKGGQEITPPSAEHVWQGGEWVMPPAAPLPDAPMWKVREYLIDHDLLDQVGTIIEQNYADPKQRAKVLSRFEFVTSVPADSEIVAVIAQHLQITVDEVWADVLAIE